MVSAIVVELPSSDEEEEKVPEIKPKASKGMNCSVFTAYRISSYSCRGNYSFLEVGVRLVFKGGNY